MFQTNEGTADRIIRAVVGIALLWAAYAKLTGGWQIAVYAVGGIVVFTSITGFCLLYRLIGLDTRRK